MVPVASAEFVIGGQLFMGYNGGPHFGFSEGFSLFVACEDQREVDEYWNKFVKAGAKPTRCGWITDQFGLTWQIIPKRFMELIGDKNPKKVQAVISAMLKMEKLDLVALERAYAEA
jgi:predicted 3-demethylubiquinone-9 3-methyltransferase (glyoxalase superfamily)